MPGFVVTRGLGPGATPSNLIARGFIPAPVVEVVRSALRHGRRAADYIGEALEELKLSVSLLAINGKELANPIINIVRTTYKVTDKPQINVTPTKLVVKQPEIKVVVKQVSNKDVSNRTNDR